MRTRARIVPLLILVVCGCASGRAAQPPAEPVAPPTSPASRETLEAQLMGVWVLAESTTPGTPSGIGIRQKTSTRGHWEIMQRDPKTGEIVFHHGGTYRLNGDILEQKVEFATQKTKSYIGQVRRFRIRIETDTYTSELAIPSTKFGNGSMVRRREGCLPWLTRKIELRVEGWS